MGRRAQSLCRKRQRLCCRKVIFISADGNRNSFHPGVPAGNGEGRAPLCFFLSVPEGTERMKTERADAGIAYN
ncbi:hypothetical protein SI93_07845 [Akkermansia muciniphila]|nr:hypothetical protein [Akkermansia muciniphila]OUN29619.1 hypothetical protein B5G29_01065 [Akkermansia muciniphila]